MCGGWKAEMWELFRLEYRERIIHRRGSVSIEGAQRIESDSTLCASSVFSAYAAVNVS